MVKHLVRSIGTLFRHKFTSGLYNADKYHMVHWLQRKNNIPRFSNLYWPRLGNILFEFKNKFVLPKARKQILKKKTKMKKLLTTVYRVI